MLSVIHVNTSTALCIYCTFRLSTYQIMEAGHSPTAPTIDAAGYLEGTSYLTVNNRYIRKTVYGLRSEVRLLLE